MDAEPKDLVTVTLVDERQLIEKLSIGRRTLYRWVSSGRFPQPVRLSDCGKRSMKRWLLHEVEGWLAKHAAEREPVPEVSV